jgi:hypothetical protein
MDKQIRTMTLDEAIAETKVMASEIRSVELRNDERAQVAKSCFTAAEQHHSAILILLRNTPPLYATALALQRPLLEAVLRGHWVLLCANDEEVENTRSGKNRQPLLKDLVQTLSPKLQKFIDDEETLAEIFNKVRCDELSSYVHTFENQIQNWWGMTDFKVDLKYQEFVSTLLNKTQAFMYLCEEGIKSLRVEKA